MGGDVSSLLALHEKLHMSFIPIVAGVFQPIFTSDQVFFSSDEAHC